MATPSYPVSHEKFQQFIVQFACRTPIRKDFSSAERKALENVLKEVDPELFQLFSDDTQPNSPHFFQAARQHIVGGAVTITVPSLILTNDSVTLLFPVKIGGRFLSERGNALDTTDMNKKMSDVLFQIQNTVRGLRYHRAGKIFEMLVGPFGQEDKDKLLRKLISSDFSLGDVGELDLKFARYVDLEGEPHNIQTVIKYQQLNLGDRFQLGVRVDINNRKLKERLDPADIEKVWGRADSLIFQHLDTILIE